MQLGDNEINDPRNQAQPVKYAGVIASYGYPDVSEKRGSALLQQMPVGAYITYDIIQKHHSFSNDQAVTATVSKSRIIDFDGSLSSRISFKQPEKRPIQISSDRDMSTYKYPVFLLWFAGK